MSVSFDHLKQFINAELAHRQAIVLIGWSAADVRLLQVRQLRFKLIKLVREIQSRHLGREAVAWWCVFDFRQRS